MTNNSFPISGLCRLAVRRKVLILMIGCTTLEIVTSVHLNGQPLTSDATSVAHIYADNWAYISSDSFPF